MSLPPNINFIHMNYNYSETFALIVQWNVFVAAVSVLSVFAATFFGYKGIVCYIRKNNYDASQAQLETFKQQNLDKQSSTDVKKEEQKILVKQSIGTFQIQSINPKNLGNKYKYLLVLSSVLSKISVLCYFLFVFFCCYLFLNMYMFGFLGRNYLSQILTILVVLLFLSFTVPLFKKIKGQAVQRPKNSLDIVKFIIIRLIIAIVIVQVVKDVCVCQYNNNYGFNLLQDSMVSTAFLRTLTIDRVCAANKICHLYATLPEDSSNSVFLTAHSGTSLNQLHFSIKKDGLQIAKEITQSLFVLDNVESIGKRKVHSVLIKGLTPSTTYTLQICDQSGNLLNSTTYRTLPDSEADTMKMAVGGDVGMTTQGIKLTDHLVQFDPDVILLGGDIAYDNAIRTCYYSWDNFYRMFEDVNRKLNRLVPIVLAIGNHDVGFDALATVPVSKHQDKIPFYFAYNVQHTTSTGRIPQPQERKSYHYHKIGPILMLVLDSGYLQTYQKQKQFINETINKQPNLIRFANYHNPIYPSCVNSKPDSNDMLVINEGTKHWTPLFDHYNFTSALEHHTHFQKMTYRIKANQINHGGVRYVGDGSWGVTDQFCPDKWMTPHQSMFENLVHRDPNHMWQVTLRRSGINYTIAYRAINMNGSETYKQQDMVEYKKG